jgi:hypothetical protein
MSVPVGSTWNSHEGDMRIENWCTESSWKSATYNIKKERGGW